MAGVWDEQLDAIPTAWLDRAFKAAFKAQRTPFPITHADVLTAWDNLIDERERAAQVDPSRALPAGGTVPCPRCHGAGWLIDRQSGGPGNRAAIKCDACGGGGQVSAKTARPTGYVNAMLPILRGFADEHRDPQNALTLIAWALAAIKAGLLPYDLRRMLESAGTDSLYFALGDLVSGTGVTIPPPVDLAGATDMQRKFADLAEQELDALPTEAPDGSL